MDQAALDRQLEKTRQERIAAVTDPKLRKELEADVAKRDALAAAKTVEHNQRNKQMLDERMRNRISTRDDGPGTQNVFANRIRTQQRREQEHELRTFVKPHNEALDKRLNKHENKQELTQPKKKLEWNRAAAQTQEVKIKL